MQPTAAKIRSTYFERFDEMPLEYRLHFASRMAAWSQDITAKDKLSKIKNEVMPLDHDVRREAILSIREELLVKNYEKDVNDYARRKPYFEKYPNLLLVHNALFRIRHWLCIYDTDERSLLFELVPEETIAEMVASLREDQEAQQILSTYFINTVYLYSKLYTESQEAWFDPSTALALGSRYNTEDSSDIRLLIYLYTHCILGETLFYHQPISSNGEAYTQMLAELEPIIEKNFDSITLDNKCEFLVCAQICGYESLLTNRINDEAEKSLNNEGFIVDTFNSAINPLKQSFVMSEHRNVLYIMAQSRPAFLD